MFRFKRASCFSYRLNMEQLEGRQLLSGLAGIGLSKALLHQPPGLVRDVAPAQLLSQETVQTVQETLPPGLAKQLTRTASEVSDVVVKPTPLGQLLKETDKAVGQTLKEAIKLTDTATDVVGKATPLGQLLQETDKVVGRTLKEVVKLTDSIVGTEPVKPVRDIVRDVTDDVLGTGNTNTPLLGQAPEAGQTATSSKPKATLGGAMLDLTMSSRAGFFAGQGDSDDVGYRFSDAGRGITTSDAGGEGDDSGARVFDKEDLEGLDLFSKERKNSGVNGAALLAAFKSNSDGAYFTGEILDGELSNGPLMETSSLDSAITRFFAQLDALAGEFINTLAANPLTPWIVGVGLGMMSVELVRRHANLRRSALAAALATPGWAPGLPLPGSDL